MSAEQTFQVLLIAGNYDIVQSLEQSLSPARFTIHNAFSHMDTLYMLEQTAYDVLIVDSAMVDRRSKKRTMDLLDERPATVPIVRLASKAFASGAIYVEPFRSDDIQKAVMGALKIGTPNTMQLRRKTKGFSELSPSNAELADEIRTLIALSKSLAEVLDTGEVLNRVVNAARDLTMAEEGMILLPEGDALYLRAKVGIENEVARNFRIRTNDSIAGEVFRSGQPTLVGASGPQKVKTQYFVNSLLYVPILLQGKPIGVLGVNNREKDGLFDKRHQELLFNLGSFAAVAIENARVHEDSIERARELETLVAASEVVNSSLSMDELLPNICQQLASVLNVDYAEIYRWSPTTMELKALARQSRGVWPVEHAPRLELSNLTAVSMALQNNRHWWVKLHDREFIGEVNHLEKVGAKAMLIVLILASGRLLGLLRCYYEDVAIPTLADDALPAVQQSIQDYLQGLSNRPDRTTLDDVIPLLQNVVERLQAKWGELAVGTDDNNVLSVIARNCMGVWVDPPQPTIDLTNAIQIREVLNTHNPAQVFVDSSHSDNATQVLLNRAQSQSMLMIPMVQRGEAKGLVVFSDGQKRRHFSRRDVDLARAIVGQAATALDNASLLTDLEKSLQDLKDAQDRLIQAARLSAMGELAAVVAHQINNPLTTIMVDAELLLLDEAPNSPNYPSLQAIQRAGKRAANVARRLLAISRPHEADGADDLIDLVDSMYGVLTLVKMHVERSQIKLNVNIENGFRPLVYAIKGSLDDAWLNLVMNAHDALVPMERDDPTIDVSLRPDGSWVEVRIWDNGPGIPPAIHEEIFSPFFTTKPVGEGTGLGLHVCREVVENTGGTIAVTSVVDEYTEFVVRLPLAKS